MPIVFVHGVPETDAIWDPLVSALGRDDVVRLSPPGFGAPVPAGFEPVRASYVEWLAGELVRLARLGSGPMDVVGHDWGAGHTYGLVATRPELVRSWVADVGGIMHPHYVWHDMAQLWRTPGVGEETVAAMMGAPLDDRTALFESLGMPEDIARRVAEANDEDMARCILALYRSADPKELRAVWDGLPGASIRPGLVLVATADQYVGPLEHSIEVAERAGARTATLEGRGHWWMLEDPNTAARVLQDFWDDLSQS